MEEKNTIKIKLSTIFLIISLIIIIIMGGCIYKLYMDKQISDSKLEDLTDEVARLESMVNELKTTTEQEQNNDEAEDEENNEDVEEYRDELSKEEKKILIVKSFSNYAWTAQFRGKVIFNDGTIYSWNFSGNMQDFGNYNVNSADGLKSYILDNGSLENEKVSSKDLDRIEKYINELEDTIEIKSKGVDQGLSQISAWNSNNEEIKLSVHGDSAGENKTENAQQLLILTHKYLYDI